MLDLYHAVISTPLLNLLVGLYDTIAFRDLGIAIAALTVIVRLAFYPLFQKGLEQQARMQQLQPKINALKEKHKGNTEAHSKALLALYKEEGFNPFSGILMMLVQIPILIALYHVILTVFAEGALSRLYAFIPNPGALNHLSLGFIDLQKPLLVLVIISAVLQFIQMRIALSRATFTDKAQQTTTQIMAFVGPVITLIIFARLPAAISVYWLVTSLLSVGQQYLATNRINARKDATA